MELTYLFCDQIKFGLALRLILQLSQSGLGHLVSGLQQKIETPSWVAAWGCFAH